MLRLLVCKDDPKHGLLGIVLIERIEVLGEAPEAVGLSVRL